MQRNNSEVLGSSIKDNVEEHAFSRAGQDPRENNTPGLLLDNYWRPQKLERKMLNSFTVGERESFFTNHAAAWS